MAVRDHAVRTDRSQQQIINERWISFTIILSSCWKRLSASERFAWRSLLSCCGYLLLWFSLLMYFHTSMQVFSGRMLTLVYVCEWTFIVKNVDDESVVRKDRLCGYSPERGQRHPKRWWTQLKEQNISPFVQPGNDEEQNESIVFHLVKKMPRFEQQTRETEQIVKFWWRTPLNCSGRRPRNRHE